jgi:hypothetical protein
MTRCAFCRRRIWPWPWARIGWLTGYATWHPRCWPKGLTINDLKWIVETLRESWPEADWSITGYVNPDGSRKGNWTSPGFYDDPDLPGNDR